MKKGFTLVELSIVLVIIGLLIGGILVAQSLIDSAKIGRLVRDLQQYEVAIRLFKNNFKYYPGDAPYFTPPGNGDRWTSGSGCAPAPNNMLSDNEGQQAWAHLSESKMLNADYIPWSPINCGGSHTNTIGGKSSAESLAGIIGPYTEWTDHKGSGKADISARKSLTSNFSLRFGIPSLEALALENKLGSQSQDTNIQQIGLTNEFGAGTCYDISLTPMGCGYEDALFTFMTYYIAP